MRRLLSTSAASQKFVLDNSLTSFARCLAWICSHSLLSCQPAELLLLCPENAWQQATLVERGGAC